jgi:hypothetical protein
VKERERFIFQRGDLLADSALAGPLVGWDGSILSQTVGYEGRYRGSFPHGKRHSSGRPPSPIAKRFNSKLQQLVNSKLPLANFRFGSNTVP